jgi:hypothetical protein
LKYQTQNTTRAETEAEKLQQQVSELKQKIDALNRESQSKVDGKNKEFQQLQQLLKDGVLKYEALSDKYQRLELQVRY